MSSGLALRSEPAAILACTVSRNVHDFDLLIEDMEDELGEAWRDLGFDEARAFLQQPEAESLIFIAIALDPVDEDDVGLLGDIIVTARSRGIRVILVADDVTPATLHQLLKLGADDFLPYPLADGVLHDAVERIRTGPTQASAALTNAAASGEATPAAATDHEGPLLLQPQFAVQSAPDIAPAAPIPAPSRGGRTAVFAVQNLAGGTGASTLAVNLAWEMAIIDKKSPPSVCLMDLDLQYGSVSTYLDLPRRDAVVEFLQEAPTMDVEAFKQSLSRHADKLSVFTAPPEILPLDLVGPDEIEAVLNFASECFDIVVIDMPRTLVTWTETVLNRADVYFTTLELDLRSAQDAMRFIKVLRSEDLPMEKVQYVINRAPGGMDLAGRGRIKKLADSLGVSITTLLPDGGKAVMQSGDHGQPLAETAKKNPLRKEILKLAQGLQKALLAEAASK